MLVHLIQAGMDVSRLNFSHGTLDEHLQVLRNVREASARTSVPVTVLQDLQGPKIRVGDLGMPSVELKAGGQLIITTEKVMGDASRVSTDFKDLPKYVHPGEMILIDDGRMRLRVVEVRNEEIVCDVVIGGVLSAHKGINLPGVPVSSPSLMPKDLDDLEWGIRNGVDYIALSFVRTAGDIRQLRQAIRELSPVGGGPPVVAKIEKPQAVAHLDAIITEADGVMIARGDLGVELPPEEIPVLQKRITRKCNAAGKPVIIATQMLESMIQNPVPTRAEASDVANAVVDGADAVMLSGETSVGKYPLETVEIMGRIIRTVESERPEHLRLPESSHGTVADRHDALGRAACVLAEQMKAAAIVTVTNSGQTARALARYRPEIPIIAVTDSDQTLRQLGIVWGVRGLVVENLGVDSDKALQNVQERLVVSGIVRRGQYIVLLAGQPFFARGSTNFIKVEKIV
jgi:pyruvate kinase